MRALIAVSLSLLICSFTLSVKADDPSGERKAYMAKIQEGIVQIRAEALDAALAAFRAAKEAQPRLADAIYYEAVTLKLKGDDDGALEAFRRARIIANQSGSVQMEARALQGAAQLLERRADSLDEARAAWIELGALLREHPSAGPEAVPAARVEAIDKLKKANANAVITKQRVADREEELRQEEAAKSKKKR